MSRRAWLMLGWGIVLLTVVDGVMLSFDPHYEPSNANTKDNNNKQRTYGPVTSVILQAVADTEEIIDAHEKLLIVLSTVAIAIFTGTLYRATSGLQALAAKQAVDINKSLEISRDAADAAKQTVKTMEETAERQLRAYVSVSSVKIIGELHPQEITNIEVYIKNSGQTPAYEVMAGGHGWAMEFPPVTEPPMLPIPDRPSRFIIPPGGTFGQINQMARAPTEAEIKAFQAGQHVLYALGEISYKDIFGIERTTRYRYACGGSYGPCAGEMCACEKGNEAT